MMALPPVRTAKEKQTEKNYKLAFEGGQGALKKGEVCAAYVSFEAARGEDLVHRSLRRCGSRTESCQPERQYAPREVDQRLPILSRPPRASCASTIFSAASAKPSNARAPLPGSDVRYATGSRKMRSLNIVVQ